MGTSMTPSGMAPEKEKKRDRVLTILLRDISNEIANIDRINGADNDAFLSYIRAMSNAKLDIILKYGMAAIHNKLFSGGGGNSPSGGTRVGEGTDGSGDGVKNGITTIEFEIADPNCSEEKRSFS